MKGLNEEIFQENSKALPGTIYRAEERDIILKNQRTMSWKSFW